MAPTSENPPIRDGQILTGPLFSEPTRVETVRANGSDSWVAGLVGTQTERFRRVALSRGGELLAMLVRMRFWNRRTPRRSTACMPRCCCKPAVTRMPCER